MVIASNSWCFHHCLLLECEVSKRLHALSNLNTVQLLYPRFLPSVTDRLKYKTSRKFDAVPSLFVAHNKLVDEEGNLLFNFLFCKMIHKDANLHKVPR